MARETFNKMKKLFTSWYINIKEETINIIAKVHTSADDGPEYDHRKKAYWKEWQLRRSGYRWWWWSKIRDTRQEEEVFSESEWLFNFRFFFTDKFVYRLILSFLCFHFIGNMLMLLRRISIHRSLAFLCGFFDLCLKIP